MCSELSEVNEYWVQQLRQIYDAMMLNFELAKGYAAYAETKMEECVTETERCSLHCDRALTAIH